MILIDLCASIASKTTESSLPSPNLSSIHQKLDAVINNQKSLLASPPRHHVMTQPPPSFSEIAKRAPRKSNGPKGAPAFPVASMPRKIPSIVLKQSVPAAPVELMTSAEILSARINKALAVACQAADQPVFKIRASSVNQHSGEILIQMHDAKDAAFATKGEALWLPSVNSGL